MKENGKKTITIKVLVNQKCYLFQRKINLCKYTYVLVCSGYLCNGTIKENINSIRYTVTKSSKLNDIFYDKNYLQNLINSTKNDFQIIY